MQRDAPKPSRRTGSGLKAITEYGPIASLARKARKLDALDRALRQTLPSPLREQVRFANLQDGRLIFLAPSSALAARLRLLQAQILSTARAVGTYANSVTVKVAPPSTGRHRAGSVKTAFASRRLSPESRRGLNHRPRITGTVP
nr:DciA family protein [Dyella terrae]